jgi:predicted site-specific integrase-resolvase
MKVKLSAWAAKRYDPAPSDWVLRKWVRQGQIHPAPELVGKQYYVEENARRLVGEVGRPSLVERLSA